MRLTKSNVNALEVPPGKSELLVFDDQLAGFGIRLRAGGKKTWIAQYRLGSKQRRISLGSIGTVDAEEARKQAKSILAKVQLGSDPQTDKFTARAAANKTLGHVINFYLASHAEPSLKPRTFAEVKRSLLTHWKPLHEAQIAGLERSAVAGQLNTIARASGPVAANRSRAYLAAMFNWAIAQGFVEKSPVTGTAKPAKELSRERVMSDDELGMIWLSLPSNDYGTIVKLLILTGQRREEVAGMRWDELDLGRGLWSIRADRTKNGRTHDVPLSPEALSLLPVPPLVGEREFVFGKRVGPFSGWSKAKAQLDDRLSAAITRRGGPSALAPWRIHDLRRTAATRMADLGVQPHIIEAVLNHMSGHKAGVAGIYNRAAYTEEKRAALTLWAEHIQHVCGA
jgi:integrase